VTLQIRSPAGRYNLILGLVFVVVIVVLTWLNLDATAAGKVCWTFTISFAFKLGVVSSAWLTMVNGDALKDAF
jgi:uncharacterized membrane protein